jgi:butyrate kinase
LLYLLEREGLSVSELTDLLYQRSGLLGISGFSADMRELLASERPAAAEAVEYFCYRTAREIGSLAAALGGLDALVGSGFNWFSHTLAPRPRDLQVFDSMKQSSLTINCEKFSQIS